MPRGTIILRIAVVSHSLVADRQAIFWNHFALQKDVVCLQIYPGQWGPHKREGGYRVTHQEMFSYLYTAKALQGLREFQPDLVYIQEEVYSMAARQVVGWARNLIPRPKIGVFVWENLRKEDVRLSKPGGIDFIVAGNKEAAGIHETEIILPQVGVDFDLFKPMSTPREYDLVFASRKETSKGYDIVEKLPYKLITTKGEPYSELPSVFNRGRIHIVLPQEMPYWQEQFLPYANVEAIACGLSCVIGDAPATRYWASDCPGITLVPSRNTEIIKEAIASQLENWTPNDEGRTWAQERFSLKAVSEDLMNVFTGVLSTQ